MIETPGKGSNQTSFRPARLSRALRRALASSDPVAATHKLRGELQECLEVCERRGALQACIACQRAFAEIDRGADRAQIEEILLPLISWLETRPRVV